MKRTGLLMLRSCVGWGYGGGSGGCGAINRQHMIPAFSTNIRVRRVCDISSSLSNTIRWVFLPTTVTNYSRSGYASQRSIRPLSSSLSSSSFEAPEPPSSQGQAVFPNIQFDHSSEDNLPSIKRNNDPEAVYVINGSSRGIGLQFVKSLLERTKGKVVACCRTPTTATELNNVAANYPDRVVILPLDVEDQISIDTLASTIATEYQRVDALFNVAGILGDGGKTTPGPERAIANVERDWLEKTLAVNTIGPIMLSKALSPLMRTTGRRSIKFTDQENNQLDIPLPKDRSTTIIVNLSARVGSISDNQLGGWYSYRLSKSALNQATRTMALELRRQGTFCLALHPGTTQTDLSAPFQKNVQEGRLFPVDFTVDKLLGVVDSCTVENNGGFYDWAGKALPF